MTHSETAGVAFGNTDNSMRPQGWRPGRTAQLLAAVTLVATGVWGTVAAAADWPQWQGPDRNAISQETGFLQAWTPEGPPLAWKVDGLGLGGGGEIGPGRSSWWEKWLSLSCCS